MRRSFACLLVGLAAAGVPLAAAAQGESSAKPGTAAPAPPAATRQEPNAAHAQPRPADAKALLAEFARIPGLEATYEEEKHLALLALPLRSKGRMLFLPPGYLARAVEAPEKSLLVITPDQLRIDGRDGSEVIDLKKSDKVRLFVSALVQVFAGNEPLLQKSFAVDYAVDAKSTAAWTLALTPKEKTLQQMTKSLTLHGEGLAVTSIVVEDPNGDRTVTRIVQADAKRMFTADERKRWFGIEPK